VVFAVSLFDYDKFVKAIKQLGLFLMVVEVPKINGYSKIHDKTFVFIYVWKNFISELL